MVAAYPGLLLGSHTSSVLSLYSDLPNDTFSVLRFFNTGTRWSFGDTRKRRKCSADFSSLFCHIHEVDGTITAFSTVGHFDKPSPPIMHFSWQRSRMPTSWTLRRRHMAVSHAIEFMLRTPDLLKFILVCTLCLSYDMEVDPQWFLRYLSRLSIVWWGYACYKVNQGEVGGRYSDPAIDEY